MSLLLKMGNLYDKVLILLEEIINLVSGWVCQVCGSPSESPLCEACERNLSRFSPPFCPQCGLPQTSPSLCPSCKEDPLPFRHRSFGPYEGTLKEMIHKFKFEGQRSLKKPLSLLLYETFKELKEPVDLIIPIPLTRKRLVERGFNQSLLLAKELGIRTGLKVKGNILIKVKETPPQTSLGSKERRSNLKGAFFLKEPSLVFGKRVLLVDDVFTTGSTLREAFYVLKQAGAKTVMAITLARSL